MPRASTAYVFIDANLALHFMRPDQIDWCALVGVKEVVLVAAPVLLRELESQKIVNGSRKLRERAATYIKWLHSFARHPETEVRPGVRWLFLPDEPQVDFSAERLSHLIADDHLIASALDHIRQYGTDVFVATADLGLEVKLRARGVSVLELSDDLRLSAEPDPLEIENRDLKRKIARIEARMPKLSVAFEDGAQHHVLSLRDPDALNTDLVLLEQVEADHPFMPRPRKVARPDDEVTSVFADIQRLASQFGVSAERVDDYNEKLERYLQAYKSFLDNHAAWRETVCLHYLVKLVVTNDGTAPASNIDLDLFFPEGASPVDDENFPKEPKPPKAPRRPQGAFDLYSSEGFGLEAPLAPLDLPHLIKPNYDGVPLIREDEDSVRIGYANLKHGFSFTSDSLIFRFTEPRTVRSFSLDYCLSADELPEAIRGQLHFRIDNVGT